MAAAHVSTTSRRPTRPTGDPALDRLVEVLADTYVHTDEQGRDETRHGLLWWYPQVKHWPSVRGSAGAGSSKPGSALAINAAASDFLTGRYWVGEDSQEKCSYAELLDDENYRAGWEPTVLGLERSVRVRLGHNQPMAQRPARDTLHPVPAVTSAMTYLLHFAPEVAAHHELAGTVREEALRLIVHARGMLHGSRWSASRGPCPKCHQTESVISDEDRAFCDNPVCRTPYGDRWCWRFDTEDSAWVEVPEPDLRGRGRVTDEQLSRWKDAR